MISKDRATIDICNNNNERSGASRRRGKLYILDIREYHNQSFD